MPPEARKRLVLFLYLLARDHVSFGDMEELLEGVGGALPFDLAQLEVPEQVAYAESLADRLLDA